MHFEWDPKKSRANRRKHGVTFQEATRALRDVFSATALTTLTTRTMRNDL